MTIRTKTSKCNFISLLKSKYSVVIKVVVAANTCGEHDTTTPHSALDRSSTTSLSSARFDLNASAFESIIVLTSRKPNKLLASSEPRPCVSGAMRLVANLNISTNAGNPYGSLDDTVCSCASISVPGPAAAAPGDDAALSPSFVGAGMTTDRRGDVRRGDFACTSFDVRSTISYSLSPT